MDRKGFLDCDLAFETFENMLSISSHALILLVRGDGKQGKSTLLSTLYNHTRTLLGAKCTGRVEFKKAGSSPEEHLASIARALGATVPASGNIVQRIDALLDACAGRPVVIFFDAFEHAEHQHRHWVGRVLERCLDDEHLRCVVAGRELPVWKNQPWAGVTISTDCDALRDTAAFSAHAIANGYKGKPEEIVAFVTGMLRIRERSVNEGRLDHGISSEIVLDEINSLCSSGRTLV